MTTSDPVVLATYTLQVIGPDAMPVYSRPGFMLLMDRAMRETEENLTDLLPEGYSVRIKEWDAPGEDFELAGLHWVRGKELRDA